MRRQLVAPSVGEVRCRRLHPAREAHRRPLPTAAGRSSRDRPLDGRALSCRAPTCPYGWSMPPSGSPAGESQLSTPQAMRSSQCVRTARAIGPVAGYRRIWTRASCQRRASRTAGATDATGHRPSSASAADSSVTSSARWTGRRMTIRSTWRRPKRVGGTREEDGCARSRRRRPTATSATHPPSHAPDITAD